MNRHALLLSVILAVGLSSQALGQQTADSTFHPSVAKPAFVDRHPRVLFDESHHNFHTLGGRYRSFGELLERDGCLLTPSKEPFAAGTLTGFDVLVISNAAGDDLESGTDSTIALPAFTSQEIEAVYRWVHAGGGLLLIADHAPFGAAAAALAKRFGVEMSGGYTIDTTTAVSGEGNPGVIEFTRELGPLGDHAILRGRERTERISRLIAFTGQSLRGPNGSTALLKLSSAALDIPLTSFARQQDMETLLRHARPAGGRSMGVAHEVGRGRIVVVGEAGMLSAQVVTRPGSVPRKMGMNRAGIDNQQFALNVVHWLTRILN